MLFAVLFFVHFVDRLSATPHLPPTHPGVMTLLRPLLLDAVPTVQQTAALALGRLANHSDDLAEAVVQGDILPQLVHSLASQNVSAFLKIFYIQYILGFIGPFERRESARALATLGGLWKGQFPE